MPRGREDDPSSEDYLPSEDEVRYAAEEENQYKKYSEKPETKTKKGKPKAQKNEARRGELGDDWEETMPAPAKAIQGKKSKTKTKKGKPKAVRNKASTARAIQGPSQVQKAHSRKFKKATETEANRLKRDKTALSPEYTWKEFEISPLVTSMMSLSLEASSTIPGDFVRWFEQERASQELLSKCLDVVEVQQMQVNKQRRSIKLEKLNHNSQKHANEVLLQKDTFSKKDGKIDADGIKKLEDTLAITTNDAKIYSRWRRDSFHFKKVLSTKGNKALKEFSIGETRCKGTMRELLEISGYEQTGLHEIGFQKGKEWSETEERRLRSGMNIFGRDWESLGIYLRLERISTAKLNSGQVKVCNKSMSKLKAKMQKVLVLYGKCALPLPPAMAASGMEYTIKGIEPLEKSSGLWQTCHVEIEDMLPVDDVNEIPFGRRKFLIPNEPIVVDLTKE